MALLWTHAAIAVVFLLATPVQAAMYHGKNSSISWLPRQPVVLTPTGQELVSDAALPTHWDWRNVQGKNFVTADVNQHIPQYCGACWIHGTVAQLNDRIKIYRNAAFPDVMLSRQTLVNCVPGEDGASPGCFGGDSDMIYEHMRKVKVPDETCNPWAAVNQKCEPAHVCKNCAPPPGFSAAVAAGKDVSFLSRMDMQGGCFAVPHFTGYGVTEHDHLNETAAMMKEIYARGPITCSMDASDDFMNGYSENAEKHEGVYVTHTKSTSTDHDVEVAGWGETQSGIKYWVVRNSWGTYWGQGGWFKLQRGANTLLIESDCTWAVPEFGEQSLMVAGRVFGDYHSGVHDVASARGTGLAAQPLAGQLDALSLPIVGLTVLITAALSALCMAALMLMWSRQDRSLRQPNLLG